MISTCRAVLLALYVIAPSLTRVDGRQLDSRQLKRADDSNAFDCHVQVDKLNYDLTTLAGEHTISRTRETPPSHWEDSVVFNLCEDLKRREGVADNDQCPDGTRACLTKTNKKDGDPDRIVAAIPLAQTASLAPSYSALSSPAKGLNLLLHAPSYPTSLGPTPQSFNLTLLCAAESSDVTFTSYDGSQLQLQWSAPAGCGSTGDQPPPEGGEDGGKEGSGVEGRVGNGLGWFFLLLVVGVLAYLGLGAYHNYSTYGATGYDLIPHRDFWREVPYMLQDVLSHLCSSVRSRHSERRGGYVAV